MNKDSILNKIHTLKELLNISTEYEFIEDGKLKIRGYYDTNKSIIIDFNMLLTIMYDLYNENDTLTLEDLLPDE